MEIRGRFHAPLMGITQAPAGIVGEGSLALTDQGVRIVAAREGRGWMNGLGAIGAVFGLFGFGTASNVLRDAGISGDVASYAGWGALIACTLAGFALGRVIGRARAWEGTVPWGALSAIGYERGAVAFTSGVAPKGRVYFHAPYEVAQQLVQTLIMRKR
jgi:hypothetical protein